MYIVLLLKYFRIFEFSSNRKFFSEQFKINNVHTFYNFYVFVKNIYAQDLSWMQISGYDRRATKSREMVSIIEMHT